MHDKSQSEVHNCQSMGKYMQFNSHPLCIHEESDCPVINMVTKPFIIPLKHHF